MKAVIKIILLVAVLGAGFYFYHSRNYYTLTHFGDTGFSGAVYADNLQIHAGDSLRLDKKAYTKRLPERGEVIAYRNPKMGWDPSSVNDAKYNPLGYTVGIVIGFPGEDMECMLGDKIILGNVQESTGDINTQGLGVSFYGDRLLIRGLRKELAQQFFICSIMRYDKMLLGSPSIDEVFRGCELAKVVAITAPAKHKKTMQNEDIAIIN